jgi:hypothetical protein
MVAELSMLAWRNSSYTRQLGGLIRREVSFQTRKKLKSPKKGSQLHKSSRRIFRCSARFWLFSPPAFYISLLILTTSTTICSTLCTSIKQYIVTFETKELSTGYKGFRDIRGVDRSRGIGMLYKTRELCLKGPLFYNAIDLICIADCFPCFLRSFRQFSKSFCEIERPQGSICNT